MDAKCTSQRGFWEIAFYDSMRCFELNQKLMFLKWNLKFVLVVPRRLVNLMVMFFMASPAYCRLEESKSIELKWIKQHIVLSVYDSWLRKAWKPSTSACKCLEVGEVKKEIKKITKHVLWVGELLFKCYTSILRAQIWKHAWYSLL